jgi:hypothetical protein
MVLMVGVVSLLPISGSGAYTDYAVPENSFLTFACKYGIIDIDCQDEIRQDTDRL